MLDRAFNPDNPFWTFVNKVIDIAILELIWILTSLPIITIGASSSAFWNCVMRICEDDEGHIYSAYFKTFAKTFKTSTLLWLIQLAVGVLLVIDVWFCFSVKETYGSFLIGAFIIVAVIYLITGMYLYPLTGRFRFDLKRVLTNSIYLGMRFFFHSSAMISLILIALVLCYFFSNFWVLLIAPLAAFYIDGKMLLWIFDHYTVDDEEEEDPEGLSDILDRLDTVSRDERGNLVTVETPESSDGNTAQSDAEIAPESVSDEEDRNQAN